MELILQATRNWVVHPDSITTEFARVVGCVIARHAMARGGKRVGSRPHDLPQRHPAIGDETRTLDRVEELAARVEA